MNETIINAKELRAKLARVLERARRGERFTVLYRSRPVCQIVPIGSPELGFTDLADEPLYKAGPVFYSTDGKTSADHDEFLYSWSKK